MSRNHEEAEQLAYLLSTKDNHEKSNFAACYLDLKQKLALAKGTLKFYAGYSSIGDCARDALAELDGEAK